MAARVPASVVGSVGLHVALIGMYFYIFHMSPQTQMKAVSNVDLMFQAPNAPIHPLPRMRTSPPAKLTPWNLLKMALPAVPHAAPETLSVKLPEMQRTLMQEAPKLNEQAHLQNLPKLQALEPSQDHEAGPMSVGEALTETHRIEALAATPALEEVGTRQVANLPQAMALEERRQEAASLIGMGAVAPSGDRAAVPQAAPLQEGISEENSGSKPGMLQSLLPDANSLGPQAQPMGASESLQNFISSSKEQHQASVIEGNKKGIEITGPLAHRKVLSYFVPPFPDWARDQRILEADVVIKFWVSSDGNVLPDMSVEQTSGYERLDHLAMDALKQWRFSPLDSDEKQWGSITFRFVLE